MTRTRTRSGSLGLFPSCSLQTGTEVYHHHQLLEEEGLEAVLAAGEVVNKEPPHINAPEEKRPPLTVEELEAKQGNNTHTYSAPAACLCEANGENRC